MDDRKIKKIIAALKHNGLFSDLELLQILKMLAGYKHSARLMYRQKSKLDRITSILGQNGIPYMLSRDIACAAICDRGKGGWANRCRPEGKMQEYSLYLGRSERAVQEAADAEKRQDDREFGSYLGYPECCNEFFNNEFLHAAEVQGDLFPYVFRNTAEPERELPFLLNTLWYFDAGFIEYWPCSFRCPEATEDAKIAYHLLLKFLPGTAAKMKKLLKNPVIYTEYSGIFIFCNSTYDETTGILKYSPCKIRKTSDTRLYQLLLQGDRLHFKNGKCFICRGNAIIHQIRNQGFCFARFTGDVPVETGKLKMKLRRIDALPLTVPHTTFIEAAMLSQGKKPAVRLLVEPEELAEAEELAEILGVRYYVSPYRAVTMQERSTGDRYVNYIKTDAPDAQYLICYAKDVKTAKRCADYEAGRLNGDGLTGLLNYPKCCVRSFQNRCPHADWLKPFLKSTPISTWYPCCTNRLGYLFSGKMLLYDYEPCSAFCRGSLMLGRKIRDVFAANGLAAMWAKLVAEVSDPVLLAEGVLVKMPGCALKCRDDGSVELFYDTGKFELHDYDVRPEAENFPLWDSDRLVVNRTKIEFFKGDRSLGTITQRQYNNRLFLFREMYDETAM